MSPAKETNRLRFPPCLTEAEYEKLEGFMAYIEVQKPHEVNRGFKSAKQSAIVRSSIASCDRVADVRTMVQSASLIRTTRI